MGDGMIISPDSPGSTAIIPDGKTGKAWMMGGLWARLFSIEIQRVINVHNTAKRVMAAGRGNG
jgi:hypothetical protein